MEVNGDTDRLTDQQAELVEKHYRLACKLAWQLVRADARHKGRSLNLALVEDARGVACLALINAALHYRPDAGVQFSTYAHVAVVRRIQRYLKLVDRERFESLTFEMEEAIAFEASRDTEETIAAMDLFEKVQSALDTLSSHRRQILKLRLLDERPRLEIAATLGCSLTAVSASCSHALSDLRKRVLEEVGVPS